MLQILSPTTEAAGVLYEQVEDYLVLHDYLSEVNLDKLRVTITTDHPQELLDDLIAEEIVDPTVHDAFVE